MRFFKKSKGSGAWLAINVGSDGLRAASIQRQLDAKPAITLCLFHAAPASGVHAPLEKLGKELQAARYQVTTLLGAGQYQMLSVDAPNVPADELKTAVRWRLKDMIDFHVDDATIDVLAIPADKAPSNRTPTMFAIAARNQVVRDRQELFDAAKVPLKAIDIPELAQRNIAQLAEPEGRALAMLTFDTEGGMLTVTFAGELFLSRRIDVPLSQLNDPNPDYRVTVYDRITLELQRSLDHFDRQFSTLSLAKLMLGPIGDAGAPLLAYLTSNLYVPVEQFDLASVFDFSATPELAAHELQCQFFMTLGAALRLEEVKL
ncbi:MAG TPA: agglutinin biogenesis protein MshI [Burkholderiaceae bacterium]